MTIGEKIERTVKLENRYSYVAPFGYYGTPMKIYKMIDGDQVFVWKTSGCLRTPEEGGKPISNGDTFKIKATIKGFGEYNGEPQIELQRVKVTDVIEQAETYEQKVERIQKEQIDSLNNGDLIWEGMRYKQYKEHYSDCETIYGSFRKDEWGHSFIDVILRADRLKASGVRGEHYSGYEFFVYQNGEKFRTCYRAVNEENALKRCEKEHPDAEKIECGKIYDYGSRYGLEGRLVVVGEKEEPKEPPKKDAFEEAMEAWDEFFSDIWEEAQS